MSWGNALQLLLVGFLLVCVQSKSSLEAKISGMKDEPSPDVEPAARIVDEVPLPEVTASEDENPPLAETSAGVDAEAEPEPVVEEKPAAEEPTASIPSTESGSVPVSAPSKPDKAALKNARFQRTAELNSMSDSHKRDTANLIKEKFEKPVPKAPKEPPIMRDTEASNKAINELRERSNKLRQEREAKSEQLAQHRETVNKNVEAAMARLRKKSETIKAAARARVHGHDNHEEL
eukprot:CAMPEP_0118935600 /NCGR_PEP_ID=MMETSP1169-20130426/15731_1 /TAXON_ID=36882 /ORGANISM="Pyramimonas obovata, Strain CCMP722" /LENGTH=233 /DNA_ID=CAMNT_0006878657 /DNA_START=72 /DNA_END=773 /DNA_ORIENTATION=-